MRIDDAKRVHALLIEDKWEEGANLILSLLGKPASVNNKPAAVKVCQALFQHLLDSDMYLQAAVLQLGPDIFNTEPESTRRAFKAIETGSLVLLMGASSMSKTYAAGAYFLLDYLRDPYYTTVKLAAVNEDHLKKNLFAHVVTLYRACVIPSVHKIIIQDSALWMGVKEAGNEFGISGIAFKQSQETSGQFKGYKYKPVRKKKHPKFGYMSRLRVLGDEGQNWPMGPFKDFNTLIASKAGTEFVKVAVAFNPESTSQHVVQIAEPEQGWNVEELDTLYDYESKSGWKVCRLDAARCENVIQKKIVYPGLQTYEGFLGYLKAGGDNSPNYFCADDSTEVLSQDGWKKHNQLVAGEKIYTVNTASGLGEWAPIKEVFAKHYDGSLCSMEGRGFSALTTWNHRWAITHKQRIESGKHHLTFKQSCDLKKHDMIPLVRPYDSRLSEAGDHTFSAIVGWVISDGTLCAGKKVVIYQSHTANAEKCDIIRSLLVEDGETFTETKRSDGITEFGFSGELAQTVREVVTKDKCLTMDFISVLSDKGRFALMDALMLGDGGVQGGGTRYFCTSKEDEAGKFSALVALCGHATVTHKRWIETKFRLKNGWVSPGCWMWYVNVRKSQNTRIDNIDVKNEKYSGIVWCPRTENGTFYARRNGTTYFTGNTFARGFPPMVGTVNTIIPPAWPQQQRGEATFIENPQVCAAIDLAFMGKDSAQLAYGRWGLASGWKDHLGNFITFKDRLNVAQDKPRHVLQVDVILPLQKHDDTVKMAEEIVAKCKMLDVTPEWVAIDKTGYGFGTWSHLNKVWGDVFGIAWNEKATERKIVAEDMEGADKQCDGVMSEMWWAFRRWLDPRCCAILINPIIPPQPIHTQLTSRRYKTGKNGIKVEAKEEYMARNKSSPDEADSLVMLVHVVRKNSDTIPGLHDEQKPRKNVGGEGFKFESVGKMVTVDVSDSISGDGGDEY